MKRINYVVAALSLLFFAITCDNEPVEFNVISEDSPCSELTNSTNEAAINFSEADEESYNLLCQLYSQAIEIQIQLCGDETGTLQGILNNLGECDNTDNTDNSCEEAVVATETAESNFNNANESNYQALCNVYRQSIENQILACGDPSGNLQNILDTLGSCIFDPVPVEGLWNLQFILSDNPLDLNNDDVATNNIITEMDCYEGDYLLFNGDGTGEYFRSSTASYSYAPDNSSDSVFYTVNCNVIDQLDEFTWVQDGVDISITLLNNGETIQFLKSTDVISLFIENGFNATGGSANGSIVEDIAFAFLKQ